MEEVHSLKSKANTHELGTRFSSAYHPRQVNSILPSVINIPNVVVCDMISSSDSLLTIWERALFDGRDCDRS